jgi:hypothetical protein
MTQNQAGGFRRTWIDHTLEVEGSAEEVGALLADVDGWPSWCPGLSAIKRKGTGKLKPGDRFTMMIKPASFHPPLPVPCELYEIGPSRIVWGGGLPGSLVRHSFEVESLSPKRSRVRQLEYATNLLAVLALIAEPGIRKHDLRWQNALRDRFANS